MFKMSNSPDLVESGPSIRSTYFHKLTGTVKQRYEVKMKFINDVDPYCLTADSPFWVDQKLLPRPEDVDIFSYFLSTDSTFTAEKFKAYKGLEATKYVKAGFVEKLLHFKIGDPEHFLVVGRVRHSMRAAMEFSKAWVIFNPQGAIKAAHCDCMAGQGEVCSHVAAIVFVLHFALDPETQLSFTDKLSKWTVPKLNKKIEPKLMKDINWNESITTDSYNEALKIKLPEWDFFELLDELEEIYPEPAILTVVEPYAHKRSTVIDKELPKILTDFYDVRFTDYVLEDLRKEEVDFSVTQKAKDNVEKYTRQQSNSQAWYKFRAGRITASKFKATCRTNLESPSESLLKEICFPLQKKIFSYAMRYGKVYENVALKDYSAYLTNSKNHVNFELFSTGFHISLITPRVGASPDGLMRCECCGWAVVEIKCPFWMKDKKTAYFVERIEYNEVFLQSELAKALKYHQLIIKPELLCRYYTEKVFPIPTELQELQNRK